MINFRSEIHTHTHMRVINYAAVLFKAHNDGEKTRVSPLPVFNRRRGMFVERARFNSIALIARRENCSVCVCVYVLAWGGRF